MQHKMGVLKLWVLHCMGEGILKKHNTWIPVPTKDISWPNPRILSDRQRWRVPNKTNPQRHCGYPSCPFGYCRLLRLGRTERRKGLFVLVPFPILVRSRDEGYHHLNLDGRTWLLVINKRGMREVPRSPLQKNKRESAKLSLQKIYERRHAINTQSVIE